MRKRQTATLSAFMTGAALLLTLPATAQDMRAPVKATQEAPEPVYSLPGVKPAKPIVTPPQAEPDETYLQSNPDGSFMVGKTRVKISGSIIMDIGNNPPSNK
ncbi:hypothetical protein [Pseudochrobactrum algeriensis]|uniref:hypothetical protein n=1 Tax=Pseudochrobactrum algeriensis TaxID=2834768 RepID=UPI001EE51B27|nr:hypothetical protein [Pseudochrobactrum algeriensis]